MRDHDPSRENGQQWYGHGHAGKRAAREKLKEDEHRFRPNAFSH